MPDKGAQYTSKRRNDKTWPVYLIGPKRGLNSRQWLTTVPDVGRAGFGSEIARPMSTLNFVKSISEPEVGRAGFGPKTGPSDEHP